MNRKMRIWLWLAAALAASAVSWFYMDRVLLPWEYYVNVQQKHLIAPLGDLYPRWVGARELLLNGKNPYGKEVSHQIQVGFYGHPIEQTYDKPQSEILDEQRFAYPVYVVFLFAPLVHIDFAVLQHWAPAVLATLTAFSVWIWIAVLRLRIHYAAAIALTLLVVSSPQIAQGLRLRQIGLLIGFLIALAAFCATRHQYFIAGVLLATSTIKPQMVALCLVWFLLWSLGKWKERWPIVAGFGAALGLLAGGGELLLPAWPRYFLEGIQAYRKYFPTTSPLRLMLGNWVGGAISVLLVIGLVAFSWEKRAVAAESSDFSRILAFFLLASTLVLPLLTPYNQVLLLLPLLAVLQGWDHLPRWARLTLGALIAWPWLVDLMLLAHPPQVDSLSQLPLLPSLLVLLFPFLLALVSVRREAL